METLIAKLRELEKDTDVPSNEGTFLTDGSEDDLLPVVKAIVGLADGELIDVSGKPNFKAHVEMAGKGFPVTCGERDAFGWLTGVIHTSKGLIVFG